MGREEGQGPSTRGGEQALAQPCREEDARGDLVMGEEDSTSSGKNGARHTASGACVTAEQGLE